MSKADEQMPLEIWTDINGHATRTQFNGGVRYIRAAEYDALREQNRVLRSNLVNCVARLEAYYGEDYPAVRDAKAALTAMSQPAQEQCSYCKRPLTDNHSFSYGVPGVPRVYKCDRADCTKPATSQEGQG